MAATLIRAATAADTEAIFTVHVASIREVCGPFYEPSVIEAWSSRKSPEGYLKPIATRVFLVAIADEKIVGFSELELEPESGVVCAVYVRPDRLRQGFGTALLHALEAAAHARSLPRLELHSTLNAVSFYEAHGYLSEGTDVASVRGDARVPCVKMHKDIVSR